MKHTNKITKEWQSLTMGNVVNTFGDVIKQVWESLIKYHTIDIKWKCTKKELWLPTEIYASPTYISDEWFLMDEYDRELAISDYLSDKYGFCHKGFTYEATNEVVSITNIEWDEEE